MATREIEFEVCEGEDDPSPVQVDVEYRAYSLEELQQIYAGISHDFDGLMLEKLPACKHLSGRQELVLEVVQLSTPGFGDEVAGSQSERPLTREEMLVEIDKRGYRPAVYEELIAYLRCDKRPCVFGDNGIELLALGSFIITDGVLFVPGRAAPHRGSVHALMIFDVDGKHSLHVSGLVRCLVVRK